MIVITYIYKLDNIVSISEVGGIPPHNVAIKSDPMFKNCSFVHRDRNIAPNTPGDIHRVNFAQFIWILTESWGNVRDHHSGDIGRNSESILKIALLFK